MLGGGKELHGVEGTKVKVSRGTTSTLASSAPMVKRRYDSAGIDLHVSRAGMATKPGTAVSKYDPDFALGQITSGGKATASQLDEFGAAQGWARSQTSSGPIKYVDEARGVWTDQSSGKPSCSRERLTPC